MNIKTSNNLALLVAEIIADLNIVVPVAPHDHPEGKDLPCVSFGEVLIWPLSRDGNRNDLVWYADLIVTKGEDNHLAPLEPIFDGGHVLQAITAGMKYWLSYRLTKSVSKQAKHFPDFQETH